MNPLPRLEVHHRVLRLDPPASPTPMIAHPDGTIWVLMPHSGVARLRSDRVEVLCDGDGLAIPNHSSTLLYSHHVHFYYDTARAAPVWLVSTYHSDPPSVLLGVWTGEGFAPIEVTHATRVLGGDGFAFDPIRGVLVHLLSRSDISVEAMATRAHQGGVRVRELGVDGAWRDTPALLPELGRSRLFAGWDRRLRAIVVIDEDTRRTFSWDGHAFTERARFPTMPWAPWMMTLSSGTGSAVYVHDERSTDHRAHAWRLDDAAWTQIEAEGLAGFGGAVLDPTTDTCLIATPYFGPGTIPTQWGEIVGDRLVPRGELLFPVSGATIAGPPAIWGRTPSAHYRHPKAESRPICALLTEDGVDPLPPAPGPTLGIVGARGALWSVGPAGEIHSLDLSSRTWKKHEASGPPPRQSGSVGVDPTSGRIALIGGEPVRGNAYLKDLWVFDGQAWTEVKAKGARPALAEARLVYHPGLAAWLVIGGRDNRYRRSTQLWICDGKRWSSPPMTWEDAEVTEGVFFSLVAWDPSSRQLFAVGDERLWIHAGEGAWRSIATIADRTGWLAYDDATRTLCAYTESESWRADLGPHLDAAREAPQEAVRGVRSEAPSTPPIDDAVWLRLRDGEVDRFWFAALDGATWSVRQGLRGAAARSSTKTLTSPEKARAHHEKAVRAKLGDGYEHAPEREAAATFPGRRAFLMKLGARGPDRLGGLPPGIDAARWPCCAECKHPMQSVALLHADQERLPLRGAAAIALFACNGEYSGGTCETWDADEGCNQAILLSADDLAAPALAAPPTGPGGEAPAPALKPRSIAYKETFEVDPGADENAEAPIDDNKVGGFPAWIQGPDTPECEACGGLMDFVAQIDERVDRALNFGGGMGYLFACPHAAKFLWQQ